MCRARKHGYGRTVWICDGIGGRTLHILILQSQVGTRCITSCSRTKPGLMKQFTSFNPDVAKYWNHVNDSFTITKGSQFPYLHAPGPQRRP